jgi:hypothetical protein
MTEAPRPNVTAAALGPEAGWGRARIELWDAPEWDRPDHYDAIATGDGRVQAQEIDVQIARRYEFETSPDAFRALLRTLVEADLLGVPAEEPPGSSPVVPGDARVGRVVVHPEHQLVVVTPSGARSTFSLREAESHLALLTCANAVRKYIDPKERGVKPEWSRGPAGPGWPSFP